MNADRADNVSSAHPDHPEEAKYNSVPSLSTPGARGSAGPVQSALETSPKAAEAPRTKNRRSMISNPLIAMACWLLT